MLANETIDMIIELLERTGFSCSVKPIDEDLMHLLSQADGKKAGNPEFDHSLHDLHENNSFWIGCGDQTGEIIATVAGRQIEISAFIETCRSYQLWYGDKIRFTEPLDIVIDHYDRIPAGNVAYIGAGWVRPDWRGRGMSWALTRLAHFLAVKRWTPDWVVGMAFSGIAKSQVPIINYGFPQIDLLATGYRLPGFCRQDVHLLTMTRQEANDLAIGDQQFLAQRPDLLLDSSFGEHLRTQRHNINGEVTTASAPAALSIAS